MREKGVWSWRGGHKGLGGRGLGWDFLGGGGLVVGGVGCGWGVDEGDWSDGCGRDS